VYQDVLEQADVVGEPDDDTFFVPDRRKDLQGIRKALGCFATGATAPPNLWGLRVSSPRSQSAISRCFVHPLVVEKFAGLLIEGGLANVPNSPNAAARFECATEAGYPVGDHSLFIDRVQRFPRNNSGC
jgi:hypothetical protein